MRLYRGYLKKAPFAESRLSLDESGLEPTALYSKTLDDGSKETRAFSPLQLLAEISLHIPKVYEQTTRMLGIYSSSSRGKKAKQERLKNIISNNFQPLEEREQERPKSSSFARCMKLVFEIAPLECSKCGDNMKIIAFIQNPKEIEKIADNLKYTTWCAPPGFNNTKQDDYNYSQI